MQHGRFLLALLALALTAPAPVAAWTAQWIWSPGDGPPNTWIAFRHSFDLPARPASAPTRIAADSRYWLWVNGELVVFDGSLKRGPTPQDGYHDELDLAPHLQAGSNTVAVLVWYWGRSGRSHLDSGRGGLLFEADVDGLLVASGGSWKHRVHDAYQATTAPPNPSPILPEHNIRFDARDDDLGDWKLPGYDDSAWPTAVAKGTPPVAPWNQLVPRPIPRWRVQGLVDYVNADALPSQGTGEPILAELPYNAQVTAYLEIDAPAGLEIDIRTDHYAFGSYPSVRTEYVTRGGIQAFESLGWFNGHRVEYTIPAGVEILELKYRESGYDADFAGSFDSDDDFYDALWEKAKRTLYVGMRDSFTDCPDRERAQWWGDMVNEIAQSFYALDRRADALVAKGMRELVAWRKDGVVLHSPIPGNYDSELPGQMLASVGWYGFWTYYLHTGDAETIAAVYPHVRDYLALWSLAADGTLEIRDGDWNWGDWGTDVDRRLLQNGWYHLALQAAIEMAELTGNGADVPFFELRKTSLEDSFDDVFWTGSEYRSPGHVGDTDERGNALAVLSGLADPGHWQGLREVFAAEVHASPFMERFVLEALFHMGYEEDALARMASRYAAMVASPFTTLWEIWQLGPVITNNHGWAGGPLNLLSGYAAGVAPETAAWATYHVLPQDGPLSSIDVEVPTVQGRIAVSLDQDLDRYGLDLSSPLGTTAIVGIPKRSFAMQDQVIAAVSVGGREIWRGEYLGGVAGIEDGGEDQRFVKFRALPGSWAFVATPAPAAIFADGFESGTTAAWSSSPP